MKICWKWIKLKSSRTIWEYFKARDNTYLDTFLIACVCVYIFIFNNDLFRYTSSPEQSIFNQC